MSRPKNDLLIRKEFKEDFPRQYSMYELWDVIRRHEDTSNNIKACELSVKQMGVLLADEMGYGKPFNDQSITNKLVRLREKGWIQTYRIFYPNTRLCPARPINSTGSLPLNRNVNFTRHGDQRNLPVISCVFTRIGVAFDVAPEAKLELPINPIKVDPIVSTTIDTIIERLVQLGLKEREIKGILNMRGFHEGFDSHTTPSNEFLAHAKKLHNCLVQCGKGKGKRVSINKWASQLEKTNKKYPKEFEEVFGWLIANLPKLEWLRASIQSPQAFHAKFDRVVSWSTMKNKNNFTLPSSQYDDHIEWTVDHLKFNIKNLPIGEAELKRAIYSFFEFREKLETWIDDILIPSTPKGTKRRLLSELSFHLGEKWYDTYLERLQELMEWDDWLGKLAFTANNIENGNPQCVRFVKKILWPIKLDAQSHSNLKTEIMFDIQTFCQEIHNE
jgi:hypothetical protein